MLFLSIDWDPSIELVKIGSFAIRYYSLMFVIAFVLGLQIMKKIFNREGVSLRKTGFLVYLHGDRNLVRGKNRTLFIL